MPPTSEKILFVPFNDEVNEEQRASEAAERIPEIIDDTNADVILLCPAGSTAGKHIAELLRSGLHNNGTTMLIECPSMLNQGMHPGTTQSVENWLENDTHLGEKPDTEGSVVVVVAPEPFVEHIVNDWTSYNIDPREIEPLDAVVECLTVSQENPVEPGQPGGIGISIDHIWTSVGLGIEIPMQSKNGHDGQTLAAEFTDPAVIRARHEERMRLKQAALQASQSSDALQLVG